MWLPQAEDNYILFYNTKYIIKCTNHLRVLKKCLNETTGAARGSL